MHYYCRNCHGNLNGSIKNDTISQTLPHLKLLKYSKSHKNKFFRYSYSKQGNVLIIQNLNQKADHNNDGNLFLLRFPVHGTTRYGVRRNSLWSNHCLLPVQCYLVFRKVPAKLPWEWMDPRGRFYQRMDTGKKITFSRCY